LWTFVYVRGRIRGYRSAQTQPTETGNVAAEPCTGLYINLERSPGRRQEIEEELRTYKVAHRYQRFPGVDGTQFPQRFKNMMPGEIGCFQSHYQALLQAKESGLPVHILEDDVLLSGHLEPFVRFASKTNLFDEFDIICTDTFVFANAPMLRLLKRRVDPAFDSDGKPYDRVNIQLIDLAGSNMACMSSYFVGPKSIGRVLDVMKHELDQGPRVAVDVCVRNAADRRELSVRCVAPFLTSVRLEHITGSTIGGRYDPGDHYDMAMQALLRHSFFIKRDLDGYAARLLATFADVPQTAPDRHMEFISKLFTRLITGRPNDKPD
jgi:GR25 family glycosyltransferase involved in LPS biosynthesis